MRETQHNTRNARKRVESVRRHILTKNLALHKAYAAAPIHQGNEILASRLAGGDKPSEARLDKEKDYGPAAAPCTHTHAAEARLDTCVGWCEFSCVLIVVDASRPIPRLYTVAGGGVLFSWDGVSCTLHAPGFADRTTRLLALNLRQAKAVRPTHAQTPRGSMGFRRQPSKNHARTIKPHHCCHGPYTKSGCDRRDDEQNLDTKGKGCVLCICNHPFGEKEVVHTVGVKKRLKKFSNDNTKQKKAHDRGTAKTPPRDPSPRRYHTPPAGGAVCGTGSL